jgi:hypothetical protein
VETRAARRWATSFRELEKELKPAMTATVTTIEKYASSGARWTRKSAVLDTTEIDVSWKARSDELRIRHAVEYGSRPDDISRAREKGSGFGMGGSIGRS